MTRNDDSAGSAFAPISPARLEWSGSTPAAPDFGDHYFSRDQGPAESRHVFLRGNHIAERCADLPADGRLVIGETGFGTGLNLLCAMRTFLHLAPADARLEYLAVEKHPLSPEDLARALAHWPEFSDSAHCLRRGYPPPVPGFHRVRLHPRVTLTLALGDATAMLRRASARVDAWFLDGFAPARNPQMWNPELFRELARLSAPGATLATFTAAGFVRRGLTEAGFAMERRKGFGGKREMLAGKRTDGPWRASGVDSPRQVLVAGAGLAGATTARALAERGCQVTVLDPAGVAGGASATPAAVLYTTAAVHPTPQNRFYQHSYLQALHWLARHRFPRQGDQGALDGVIQLPPHERGRRRAMQALTSPRWPGTLLASAENETGDPAAVLFPGGGYLHPAAWCRTLLDHSRITLRQTAIARLSPGATGQEAHTGEGSLQADVVVLANAGAAPALAGLDLPIRPVRGQVTRCRATRRSRRWHRPLCHQGYLTPALEGLHCVGATFEQHSDRADPDPADDRHNLQRLRENLPGHWEALGGENIEVHDHHAGVRWQSRDFLPLVGPVPGETGLYLNIAHGSRGLAATPLCAELLASHICGDPLPLDREMLDALLPERFI